MTLTGLTDTGEFLFQTTTGPVSVSITDGDLSGTFTAECASYPVAPEPSSLMLAGMGGLGLVVVLHGRRRDRRGRT